MIRFVPISKEHEVITETDCFAFFNTLTSKFIELDGDQVFENAEDLREAWSLESGEKPSLERLIAFLPNDLNEPRGK